MKSKKISLKNMSGILTDNEMKFVTGGYGSGTCGWSIDHNLGICGVSKDTALELYYSFGGWWCCDHCSSTPYCG